MSDQNEHGPAKTVDQLLAERGAPLQDDSSDQQEKAKAAIHRMASQPIKVRVPLSPPIIIEIEQAGGPLIVREYARRVPTLDELAKLLTIHDEVQERIEADEAPTQEMYAAIFSLCMEPAEAKRLVKVENAQTLMAVVDQVAAFARAD